jgi:hypothetical protein
VLAGGPRTGAEVAEAVGADPELLTRVLRGLVLEDVLAEEDGGRFALTEVGECLRGDLPGSIRGPTLVRAELYYRAAAGMLAAVRHGGTAFEQVYGDRFFDYLARHPDQEATFQSSMTGRAEQEAGDVVAAYDVGGSAGWSTSAAATASCSRRCSGRRRRCAPSWSTGRRWSSTLAGAGFRVDRVVPTGSPAGLSVIEAFPTD